MEFDQSLDLKRDTLFDAVFLYAATALFALTIVLATVQVVVRVFGIRALGGMHWTEPAARFVLIVATYWGAAVASRNDEHIRMNYVLDKLEERYPRVRHAFEIVAAIIVVAFVLIALRGTTASTINNWATSIGGIDFVTSGVLYLGISIGLFVMLVYEGTALLEDLRRLTGRADRSGGRTAGGTEESGTVRSTEAIEESEGVESDVREPDGGSNVGETADRRDDRSTVDAERERERERERKRNREREQGEP